MLIADDTLAPCFTEAVGGGGERGTSPIKQAALSTTYNPLLNLAEQLFAQELSFYIVQDLDFLLFFRFDMF